MKTLITTIIALALSAGILFASGAHSVHDHFHSKDEMSKQDIKRVARKQITTLIRLGKIDKIWLSTPVLTMKIQQFKKHEEWVVHYENKTIEDKTKQSLYIFVSLYGKITGSNHTGN